MGMLRDDQPKKPGKSERDGGGEVATLGQLVASVSALSRAAVNAAKQRGRAAKPTKPSTSTKPSDSLAELRRRAKRARAEIKREQHKIEHGLTTHPQPERRRSRMELEELINEVEREREKVENEREQAKTNFDDADQETTQLYRLLSEVMATLNELRAATTTKIGS